MEYWNLKKHQREAVRDCLRPIALLNKWRRDHEGQTKPDRIVALLIILSVAVMAFVLAMPGCAHAEMDEVAANMIVEAIYKAEGGAKAKKPYGILSVRCETKEECRRIAYNTVVNNYDRYLKYGYKTHISYLEFLASRYAPIGAENDPKGYNKNWLKNVTFFVERAREEAGA